LPSFATISFTRFCCGSFLIHSIRFDLIALTNYEKPLRVEHLATIAGMIRSTLHLHFRALTAMSPLQFQKQLRLHAARQRMLTSELDAASAAFEVGYESPSQFNREYRRFFGQPPIRDIKPCETAKSWRSLLLDAELLGCHGGNLFSTVANRPVSLIEIAARLTVTGFAEHFLAGNLRSAGKLLAHYDDEEDFSLKKLRRNQYLGYTFGYRRQFALISASYAKLQVGRGLAGSLITLDYAYLS
jgi:AraC-like DNA-binding protein